MPLIFRNLDIEELLKRYLLLKYEIGEPTTMVCIEHPAGTSCPRSFHPRMLSYKSFDVSISQKYRSNFNSTWHKEYSYYGWFFTKNGKTHVGYFVIDDESFRDYLRLSEAFDI